MRTTNKPYVEWGQVFTGARLWPPLRRIGCCIAPPRQGVSLDDVRRPVGHTRPRATRLYDRRQKKVMRDIVERTMSYQEQITQERHRRDEE